MQEPRKHQPATADVINTVSFYGVYLGKGSVLSKTLLTMSL